MVGADPGSIDLYDARVGGGFVEPLKPVPCFADACQSLPAPPQDPTPATLVPNPGNPPLRVVKAKAKKKAKKRQRARGKGKHRGRTGGKRR